MKKKNHTAFRTTITIPQELKDRMDKAGDGINWSALAAAAFKKKLDEIASTNSSPTDVGCAVVFVTAQTDQSMA